MIVSIIGARPQFIKAAPVSRALRTAGVEEFVIHTGQHYDANMSRVFFDELEMREPDINLAVGSATHPVQTARMLEGIAEQLGRIRPMLAVVYGDTNSTLAGSLAAAQLRIPVAHIEAGLRSHRRDMAEETNRVVADRLSELLFSPTDAATQNLVREGTDRNRIYQVGDVMLDSVAHTTAQGGNAVLGELGLTKRAYALATIHRAETTDDPSKLAIALRGLELVADELPVVVSLHPRTRAAINRLGLASHPSSRVVFLEPVSYRTMIALEANAAVIVTDSGGVQKEAFFAQVPCVTLRAETEWVELVHSGWNRLAPPVDAQAIAVTVLDSLRNRPATVPALFGDGHASERIVRCLQRWMTEQGSLR